MLGIVYPICCGMDVHKSFLVACAVSTNSQGVTTYKSTRFSTFTGDLRRCVKGLAKNNCKDVCIESTGKYWLPIYNILEPACNIVLAHLKYVKAIRGRRPTRRIQSGLPAFLESGSFIPPADIRQLQDLVRYRRKLTNLTTGKKNQAQNCLTVSNIKPNDVFSDIFGKVSSAITSHLLDHPAEKIADISAFRAKGIKATDEQILAAVDGEICVEQAEKLHIIRSHMNNLDLCKLNLKSLILPHHREASPPFQPCNGSAGNQVFFRNRYYFGDSVLICPCSPSQSICAPGSGLCCRTVRVPGRRKPAKINRAGAYINPLLVQRALCAIRAK